MKRDFIIENRSTIFHAVWWSFRVEEAIDQNGHLLQRIKITKKNYITERDQPKWKFLEIHSKNVD